METPHIRREQLTYNLIRILVFCASIFVVRRGYFLYEFILKIEEIYVPTEHRKKLDLQRVESVAEKIMNEVKEQPILVRQGQDRYVLVKGVHRLEASKALGEETIQAYLVDARQH